MCGWSNRFFTLKCILIFSGWILIALADKNSAQYSEKMKQTKETLLKMIQKETHQLSGFDEFATIPVNYPLDICLMEINRNLYAVTLNIVHNKQNSANNTIVLQVLKKIPDDPQNPLRDYALIFQYETNAARWMDCESMGTEGYIAVVNTIKSNNYADIGEGSPVFQLKNDKIIPVQYFTIPHQIRVGLLRVHNILFMVQTFDNIAGVTQTKARCPILQWSESTFTEVQHLPCTNAVRFEPFIIEHQPYVAVANYMDEHGNHETYCKLYEFNANENKFILKQNIKSYGAIDIKHFHINDGSVNEHYLIVANTKFEGSKSMAVIFHFDHGKFVPVQVLDFETAITQFLPVVTENKEFVLLIASQHAPIQSYQFDSWKFVKTSVSFTGGAFGRGVSRMRTHKINDEFLVLVVANSQMLIGTPNLYRVRFTTKIDFDFSKAFNMFDDWYDTVKYKIKNDGLIETFHKMEKLEIPHGFGDLSLEESNVNVLHADLVSSSSSSIDFAEVKQSLEHATELLSKESVRRPKRLNDSVHQNCICANNCINTNADLRSLNANDEEVEEEEEETTLNVNELIITDKFTTEYVNGHHISDLLSSNENYKLNNLTIAYLVIPADSNTKRFKRDLSMPIENDGTLNLNNIELDGLMNGVSFADLFKNALRTDLPEQQLDNQLNVNTIQANEIQMTHNILSGKNLDRIADINGQLTMMNGPFVFKRLLRVDELLVVDRINQITVTESRLNILFKRSKHMQMIVGEKIFESVNLLEPIVLRGKINISSPIMNKIKPIVTIDDDLTINGDVIITGNITVKLSFDSSNVFGRNMQNSLDLLQTDGLRTDETNIDLPLDFEQPIHTNDVRSTRLNDISLDSFIPRNVSDIQKITGRKVFISNLDIEDGFCEINEVNGVNIPKLNETMLKQHFAGEQIVTGTIRVKRITAQNINRDSISFRKVPIEHLLTNNTDQIISGNVIIHGNVIISNDSELIVNHLFTKNDITNIDLIGLLDDSLNHSNKTIHIASNKQFENVIIEQMIVESDFWQVRTTDEIINHLQSLMEGVVFNETTAFGNQFTINDVTVYGDINDIPNDVFGQQWLLLEGKQTFLASQNFTHFTSSENIQLYGYLNKYSLPDLVDETIFRNTQDPVYFRSIAFENLVIKKSLRLAGRLADIKFPDDLILSNSDKLQNFVAPIHFASTVNVSGILSISDTLNGNSFSTMCNLIDPKSDYGNELTIKGEAIFSKDPIVVNLNSEPFEQIVQTVWFADDSIINFSSAVTFSDVILHQPITTTGLVNGLSLENINDRYLSLTKPQTISAPITFKNTVQFTNSPKIDTIALKGHLKLYQSDISFNISHFNANVLKNTTYPQFISGPWKIREFQFFGKLSSTTLNNLTLKDDVVRWDRENVIRAEKSFNMLHINRLYCHYGCSVQGVNVEEWFTQGILSTLNYTIQGNVFIKNGAISYIDVLGTVNNETFNSNTILLKSAQQQINHMVTIGPNVNHVAPLTFNEIYLNSINDQNFTAFYENLVKSNGPFNEIDGNILSNMQFTESLTFNDLTTSNRLNGFHNIDGQQYRTISNELDKMADQVAEHTKFKHFDRLIVRQTIPAESVQYLSKLNAFNHNDNAEFIAWNGSGLQFFNWNHSTSKLQLKQNVKLFLPQNTVFLNLKIVGQPPLIAIQLHDSIDGTFIQQFYNYSDSISIVYELKRNHPTEIVTFDCENKQRGFILGNETDFEVFCINSQPDTNNGFNVHSIDLLKTSSMNEIRWISGYENTVILWLNDDKIEIRSFDTHTNRMVYNRQQFIDIASVDVKQFGNKRFIAVCTNSKEFDIKLKSKVHIYGIDDGVKLNLMQTIEIGDELIVQCEFTKLSIMENILILSTYGYNGNQIRIYQDFGMTGFNLLDQHQVHLRWIPNENVIYFKLYENDDGYLEFIGIWKDEEIIIVECIRKGN